MKKIIIIDLFKELQKKEKENNILNKIEKLRVLANNNLITGNEFLDKFFELKNELN